MTSMLLLALGAAVATVPAVQDAQEIAVRLLEDGSSAFNNKDVAALANSYAEDAVIELISQSEDGFDSTTYEGREAIRTLYTDLFSNAASVRSKNVVEYARLVGPDLLLIGGTFEPNRSSSPTLQFVQLRTRTEDGTWLIRRLTLIPIPSS
ncbi:YybH family protein [Tautonia sociabilis]|uniref:SnoaL-like domain-containing protein n=1 Tax=Tautonia sociabilis TaxID=2080755 RepID=A0A432MKC3_9BACT|nr:nuclear transport factor 2 family protein [Tautonia sociabilis]RUL87710.1 hypothetical protein TsocGM_11025 [Tautonia sociabilis]